MKELTKVFKGVSIPVEIIDEQNMYFDITGIASKYGKNITKWKSSKRILELTEELKKGNSYANFKFIKITKQFGKNETTQIHRSLFMNFARFISIDFEIEADKILYDILTGNKVLIQNEINKFYGHHALRHLLPLEF